MHYPGIYRYSSAKNTSQFNFLSLYFCLQIIHFSFNKWTISYHFFFTNPLYNEDN